MSKGLEIKVFGRVQGVWYRGNTEIRAKALRLTGWVQNEPDGSVLINAFGSPLELSELQEWCKSGPEHARVEKILVREIPFEAYQTFTIRR